MNEMKGTETRMPTEKYGITWTQKTTVEELLNSIKDAVTKAYAAGEEAGQAKAAEITAEISDAMVILYAGTRLIALIAKDEATVKAEGDGHRITIYHPLDYEFAFLHVDHVLAIDADKERFASEIEEEKINKRDRKGEE